MSVVYCHVLLEYMDNERKLSKCYIACSAWNCLSRLTVKNVGYKQRGLSESLLKPTPVKSSWKSLSGSAQGARNAGTLVVGAHAPAPSPCSSCTTTLSKHSSVFSTFHSLLASTVSAASGVFVLLVCLQNSNDIRRHYYCQATPYIGKW